ncbi:MULTISPECIES: hypothetical protein [Methylobacterium]|uniref:hypothetical protein n=1 Tax=Methylobacterium TaxID=407 RepID=UPI0013EC8781|nr:hypothetical protein [Methylobacterium sp. DB0501]NGM37736.1 hypothetical protein [Methylobacterium sp. DB0501]
MPTDLPSRRQYSQAYGLSTLRVAINGLRLRLLGWRIEQALEERDHIKFLRYLNAWAELHRRASEGSGPGAFPSATETSATEGRNLFCDRARDIVSKIAREERRLARIVGRLKLARLRGSRRDYERSYAVGQKSYDRTLRLWQHISLSFQSRR